MLRKHYSREFKQTAVQVALAGGKAKTQLARDLGITVNMLYRWIEQFGPPAPDAPARLTPDERTELTRLRRENTRLQMERDILKKAIGIFSETQR